MQQIETKIQCKAERRKAYKAQDPLTTINHIRTLLVACDLFTIEFHRTYPVPGVHCCRVLLGDSDVADLGIGSNGKGLTARYALASAYGELMERLQNNILFPLRQLKFATRKYLAAMPAAEGLRERLEKEDLVLDFHYGPDEVYLDTGSLVEDCSDVLAALLGIADPDRQKDYLQMAFGEESVGCLPYYSAVQNQVRYLPIKLIWNMCGTNGMCAGNTTEEALIQGISEVMERYVIRSIYQQNITPPTVPAANFQNAQIFDHIQRLEEAGITAVIKDCSLGMGLPVIGLLLISEESNKYTFHVGADPCPITALERCLTEIYQGNPQDIEARFHSYPEGTTSNLSWQAAYYDTTSGGLGQWPNSLFADKPSYAFNGFSHPISESDSADLAYLLAKVQDLGRNLFIRDVSFLGFPSYQIFIPGMSETDFLFDDTDFPNWMAIVRNHSTLLNLEQAGPERIARLAEAISCTDGLVLPVAFEPGRWFLSNIHPELRKLSKDYLLTLLYSRLADYSAAAASMGAFLKSEAACSGPILYYRTVRSYLEAKRDGLPDDWIKEMLTERYGEVMAAKVAENFAVPELVLAQTVLPSCFDCNNCKIEGSCRYLALLRRVKTLQRMQQSNLPRQAELAKVFGNRTGQV
ncbi:hypothetical protein Desor_3751 [Desulfosporosinus orientis DSM 765]|uniref:YcaO domain-containing protein n=1 Tax=Desulfosporosinus orientis (strain ATCC 19365 / DSM 765 / NCIMB 8382 / VKM B-1628 / Singapore I) TaxID=768706 RepID=G7W6T2_DESOD|nr:YcaO-like family protein [Desulfosporosinus orientis]AET69214.1 hypothetical protein Desor_3751 [Desulfosporosinus orientis DSM 765]